MQVHRSPTGFQPYEIVLSIENKEDQTLLWTVLLLAERNAQGYSKIGNPTGKAALSLINQIKGAIDDGAE